MDLAIALLEGQRAYADLKAWISTERDRTLRGLLFQVSPSNTEHLHGYPIERLVNLLALYLLFPGTSRLPATVIVKNDSGQRIELSTRTELASYLSQIVLHTNTLHNQEELLFAPVEDWKRRMDNTTLSDQERIDAAHQVFVINRDRASVYAGERVDSADLVGSRDLPTTLDDQIDLLK